MPSLKAKIESLLFISNQPLSIKRLVSLTGVEKEKAEEAIKELISEYNQKERGVQIQKIGEQIQMVTTADNAKIVKDFIKEETTGELTRPALETLTIIAYRGPVSRAEIEQIRGVNCAIILRHLLIRGLVESAEDKKKMQMVYNITFDFLKFLGINEQSELPDYEKLNSNESLEKILN
ncbi:MAG: SMC-Scp complex subunit ScpB [Candidatus Buchananbacteria bacterium RIFCSPHIGHO2_01_FULL_39_14]|uniref:SMC-Scp complex subunit ScpB n=2 Tax=Candidatus Buchananiibacteriota TaxID=1817903 RepID=A0A1G1YUN1_9BACT|nr:MAG: SMC-Scp complex subunit ScpB [Candidatus Buchananbacteria bacterium RIFCSPHIGHO2_01_FULL_39_14]OGY49308.1 MAG: SMC-Scp complex subunit ScpB [Candidatus Buchananbacteria bacterium RIFCSPHIGHO2_02_FULL_39_17]OGY55117.1 MAG: SMC-Scp complex subunit ScpB [Candidatus Buchananbacteria bacterium RIFCSPLOWO2_01_FULL_40_23b]